MSSDPRDPQLSPAAAPANDPVDQSAAVPVPGVDLAPCLRPTAALDMLHDAPERFRFFQAVRLLFRAHDFDGSGQNAGSEPIRFGVTESLSFPPGEIQELLPLPDHGTARHRMVVNFLGLTGPSGVLPYHYTRVMIERARRRDHATRDFFDIFNHRLLLLFWRAWRKHRPEIELEFGSLRGIPRHVFDLVGMGTPTLFGQLRQDPREQSSDSPVPAAALAYYSGLITQRPHGLGSISQVVGDVVGAPVNAHGCHGNWQVIAVADRTRLGRSAHRLGDGCVLGARFWDRQTTLQLVLGPLDRARFERLLPSGALLGGLVELTRFLTGLALDLRIRLALAADQVPPTTLGSRAAQPSRLGWNTWLGGRRSASPADEVEFRFQATGESSWQ